MLQFLKLFWLSYFEYGEYGSSVTELVPTVLIIYLVDLK